MAELLRGRKGVIVNETYNRESPESFPFPIAFHGPWRWSNQVEGFSPSWR